MAKIPNLKSGGTSPRDIWRSLGKGWNTSGIAIGSLVTDQSIGTGEREAKVKHDNLIGKIFSKFIQYPVALGEEANLVQLEKPMQGT